MNFSHSVAAQTSVIAWPKVQIMVATFVALSMVAKTGQHDKCGNAASSLCVKFSQISARVDFGQSGGKRHPQMISGTDVK